MTIKLGWIIIFFGILLAIPFTMMRQSKAVEKAKDDVRKQIRAAETYFYSYNYAAGEKYVNDVSDISRKESTFFYIVGGGFCLLGLILVAAGYDLNHRTKLIIRALENKEQKNCPPSEASPQT